MTSDLRLVSTVVVIVPALIIWLAALVHIVARRPDLSFSWKGIWAIVILAVPYIGVFIYTMLRPPRSPRYSGTDDPTAVSAAIAQLRSLTTSHADGIIDDEEFAAAKARIFGLVAPTI
jgi:hypothetical protein